MNTLEFYSHYSSGYKNDGWVFFAFAKA